MIKGEDVLEIIKKKFPSLNKQIDKYINNNLNINYRDIYTNINCKHAMCLLDSLEVVDRYALCTLRKKYMTKGWFVNED